MGYPRKRYATDRFDEISSTSESEDLDNSQVVLKRRPKKTKYLKARTKRSEKSVKSAVKKATPSTSPGVDPLPARVPLRTPSPIPRRYFNDSYKRKVETDLEADLTDETDTDAPYRRCGITRPGEQPSHNDKYYYDRSTEGTPEPELRERVPSRGRRSRSQSVCAFGPVNEVQRRRTRSSSEKLSANNLPAEDKHYEFAALKQFGGSYVWPMVHKKFEDDKASPLYPKNVAIMPIEKRPEMGTLQCIAEGYAYGYMLDEAAFWADSGDPRLQLTHFLMFQSYFLNNLRRLVAPAKPIPSFVGETYDADLDVPYGISAILEQVTLNITAMASIGSGWSMNSQVVCRDDGIGFTGLGYWNTANDEVKFDYNINFIRKLRVNGKPFDYIDGTLTAKSASTGATAFMQLNEHVKQRGIYATVKVKGGKENFAFFGPFAGRPYVKVLTKNGMPTALVPAKNLRREYRKYLNRIKSDNLPKSDSRFREDLWNLARHYYIPAKAAHKELLERHFEEDVVGQSAYKSKFFYRKYPDTFKLDRRNNYWTQKDNDVFKKRRRQAATFNEESE
uniref:Chromo domain-containing protein n=1 Tax=Panagrellus redivivus TaxID=6233 RepID=A0A7E4ZQJ0_PANRE